MASILTPPYPSAPPSHSSLPSSAPQLYPHSTGYPTPPMLGSHSPAASYTSLSSLTADHNISNPIPLPALHLETLSPSSISLSNGDFELSRSWPIPEGELQVPGRERSLSQPQPQQYDHRDVLNTRLNRLSPRPKSLTMETGEQARFVYGTDVRAMSTSPQSFYLESLYCMSECKAGRSSRFTT